MSAFCHYNHTLTIYSFWSDGVSWPRRTVIYPAHYGMVGYSDIRVLPVSGKVAVHFDTAQVRQSPLPPLE